MVVAMVKSKKPNEPAKYDPVNKELAAKVLFEDEHVANALREIGVFVVDHDPGNPRISPSMLPEELGSPKDNAFGWIQYVHPDDREWVRAAWEKVFFSEVDVFRNEFRFKSPEMRSYRWVSNVGTVIYRHEDGSCALYIGADRDITEHKRLEEQLAIERDRLSKLVIEDEFLKIPNRRYLQTRQAEYFDSESMDGIGVIVFDIDNFKKINTDYSHKGGDTVLLLVVKAVKKLLRLTDTVARFAGDEFVVIINRATEQATLQRAEALLKAVQDIEAPWEELNISISLGVYHGKPETDESFWDLFDRADEALFEAKEAGRAQVKLFQVAKQDN